MLLLRESVLSGLGLFCVGAALAAPFVSELRAVVAPPANSGADHCAPVPGRIALTLRATGLLLEC